MVGVNRRVSLAGDLGAARAWKAGMLKGPQFLWSCWLWLFCKQAVVMKELGQRPEGTGTPCPVGEGCSEQGTFLFPSLNIRAVSLGGAGVTWEGAGVPAGEVPYGLLGMMMGVRGGMRLHLQGGSQRRPVRV